MTLFNIQYLRGVAALMVVLFHVLDSSGRLGEAVVLPAFPAGEAGVDLFFVISGFIIWHTSRDPGLTPGRFMTKRIKRVVPLYWFFTLAMAAIVIVAPSLLRTTVFEPMHVIASLAFVPYLHPTLHAYNPLVFVGWTLNYEMAFYVAFALLVPLTPGRRTLWIALGGAALVAVGQAIGSDRRRGLLHQPDRPRIRPRRACRDPVRDGPAAALARIRRDDRRGLRADAVRRGERAPPRPVGRRAGGARRRGRGVPRT